MTVNVNQNPEPVPSHDVTVARVVKGLDKMGDLPIFSASVNRVRIMSSSNETEVMDLAKEIMKDASLTTKLLRVSNSSYYNRGSPKISVISRSIVILGYDTVKSITLALKVIDSFQYDHPSVDMASLLARSFMSAGFVKELAIQSGVKDPEESFVCALLHNLGEIIIATILTQEYLKVKALTENEKNSWDDAQRMVLGTTMKKIARDIFKQWEFPDTVIKTVDNYKKKEDGPVKNKVLLNRAMSSLSNNLIGSLYTPECMQEFDYSELMSSLSDATGLDTEKISASMITSFKMSCELAQEYGLDKKVMQPKISADENDSTRDKIARSLSFYASGTKNNHSDNNTDTGLTKVAESARRRTNNPGSGDNPIDRPANTGVNQTVVLSTLNEISNSILRKADINSIFGIILEGINHGVGFDRAILCFLSPNKKQYKARLGSGPDIDKLKEYFSFDIDVRTDIFSQVLMDGGEKFVQDTNNQLWINLLPEHFALNTGANKFAIASLKIGENPVGLFYADTGINHCDISPEQFSGFIQLVTQAKLALSAR